MATRQEILNLQAQIDRIDITERAAAQVGSSVAVSLSKAFRNVKLDFLDKDQLDSLKQASKLITELNDKIKNGQVLSAERKSDLGRARIAAEARLRIDAANKEEKDRQKIFNESQRARKSEFNQARSSALSSINSYIKDIEGAKTRLNRSSFLPIDAAEPIKKANAALEKAYAERTRIENLAGKQPGPRSKATSQLKKIREDFTNRTNPLAEAEQLLTQEKDSKKRGEELAKVQERERSAEEKRRQAEAKRAEQQRKREADARTKTIRSERQSERNTLRRILREDAITNLRTEDRFLASKQSVIPAGDPLGSQIAERRRQIAEERLAVRRGGRSLRSQDVRVLANRDFTQSRLAQDVNTRVGAVAAARAGDSPEKLTRELRKQYEALEANSVSARKFGDQVGLAAKRYAAFVIGTAILFKVSQAFATATEEALKFEKAQTRLSQILDTNRSAVSGIVNNASNAAVATGTSATDILTGVDILAQAGFQSVSQLTGAIDKFAKVPLSATFGNIGDTADGLLTILRQFNLELSDQGSIFDKVSKVAADYAVEVKDVFEGVKRGGAVFAETGGNFDEFLSLFTLLRSRTRESSETLGVFFKTVGFRLFRGRNESLLKQLGVDDPTLPGRLRQLSEAFNRQFRGNLKDPRAVQLAERIGGVQQGGRLISVIEAIQQDQGRIQQVIAGSGGFFDRETAKRVEDIGTSFNRIQESVNKIVAGLTQSDGLRSFIKGIADATVGVANFLRENKAIFGLLGLVGGALVGTKAIGVGRGIYDRLFGGQANALLDRQFPINAAIDSGTGQLFDTNRVRRAAQTRNNSRFAPILNGFNRANNFIAGQIGSPGTRARFVDNDVDTVDRNGNLVTTSRNAFNRRVNRRIIGGAAIGGVAALGLGLAAGSFDAQSERERAQGRLLESDRSRAGAGLLSGIGTSVGLGATAAVAGGPVGVVVGVGIALAGITKSLYDFNDALNQAVEDDKKRKNDEQVRQADTFDKALSRLRSDTASGLGINPANLSPEAAADQRRTTTARFAELIRQRVDPRTARNQITNENLRTANGVSPRDLQILARIQSNQNNIESTTTFGATEETAFKDLALSQENANLRKSLSPELQERLKIFEKSGKSIVDLIKEQNKITSDAIANFKFAGAKGLEAFDLLNSIQSIIEAYKSSLTQAIEQSDLEIKKSLTNVSKLKLSFARNPLEDFSVRVNQIGEDLVKSALTNPSLLKGTGFGRGRIGEIASQIDFNRSGIGLAQRAFADPTTRENIRAAQGFISTNPNDKERAIGTLQGTAIGKELIDVIQRVELDTGTGLKSILDNLANSSVKDFTTGLDKAQEEADKFAQSVQTINDLYNEQQAKVTAATKQFDALTQRVGSLFFSIDQITQASRTNRTGFALATNQITEREAARQNVHTSQFGVSSSLRQVTENTSSLFNRAQSNLNFIANPANAGSEGLAANNRELENSLTKLQSNFDIYGDAIARQLDVVNQLTEAYNKQKNAVSDLGQSRLDGQFNGVGANTFARLFGKGRNSLTNQTDLDNIIKNPKLLRSVGKDQINRLIDFSDTLSNNPALIKQLQKRGFKIDETGVSGLGQALRTNVGIQTQKDLLRGAGVDVSFESLAKDFATSSKQAQDAAKDAQKKLEDLATKQIEAADALSKLISQQADIFKSFADSNNQTMADIAKALNDNTRASDASFNALNEASNKLDKVAAAFASGSTLTVEGTLAVELNLKNDTIKKLFSGGMEDLRIKIQKAINEAITNIDVNAKPVEIPPAESGSNE